MMREKPSRSSMELVIETLAGTSMSLRVSPHDTVRDVKDYIQKLEGIPSSQQHLVWQASELEDDRSLHDCQVYNGATLRLVLNMRGGPVNTRRVPSEEPTLHEMAEYFAEASRSDLVSSSSHHRPVTVVVCQSGNQLNFYRLMSAGDVSPSLPCSRSSSDECAEEDEEEFETPVRERHEENNRTRNKMKAVRLRMETQKESRDKPPTTTVGPLLPRPPLSSRPVSCNRLRRMSNGAAKFLPVSALSQKPCLPPVGSHSVIPSPSSTNLHRVSSAEEEAEDITGAALDDLLQTTAPTSSDGGVLPIDGSPASMAMEPVVDLDGELFSKTLLTVGSAQMLCTEDGDFGHSAPRGCDDAAVNVTESGSHDIVVGAVATAEVTSTISFAAEDLPPCPPVRSKSRIVRKEMVGSSSRSASSRSAMQSSHGGGRSRSNPEAAFFDTGANSKFASAIVSALGETAMQRSVKLGGTSAVPGRNGSNGTVVLRSLNSREMRAMSGILSTIVHSRGGASATSSRASAATVVGACRLSGNGLATVADATKPTKAATPTVDGDYNRTEILNVLPRKLPPLQDNNPSPDDVSTVRFGLPLPPSSASSLAVSAAEAVTAKTATKRCATCGKKTRLATSFSCRCGGNFCGVHRYAEVHDCSFDYKSEGRRLIEQNNPLVTAAKLPKI